MVLDVFEKGKLGVTCASLATLALLPVAAILSLFAVTACQAGCPNDFHKLDDRARQAADAFNATAGAGRCAKARELVRIEQKLSRFVEEYQVQCVLDQEVIDVQRRRLGKARAARDQACRR